MQRFSLTSNRNPFLIAAALTVGLLSLAAHAAEKRATISGKVSDSNGKPAAGTLVFLDGFGIRTNTDKEGRYALKGVPWGLHTVVALHRGYKPGKRLNLEVRRGAKIRDLDFELEPDPAYVPDAIKLDEISPAPDAILPPNKEIEIRGTIRYRLRNDTNAKVVLGIQDDRGNQLLADQARFDIKQGSSSFAFRRTIRTPSRFGNAEIYLIAALISTTREDIEATDSVTYQVRTFNDDLRFGAIALSQEESRPKAATFSVSVDYLLDTVTKGTVRLRVLGADNRDEYSEQLFESSQPVDLAQSPSGTLDFSGSVQSSKAKKVKMRVDLIVAGEREPKLIKWSKSYAPWDAGPRGK